MHPSSSEPTVDQIEQARRRINELANEIANLSEMELPPMEYFEGFLQRLMQALAAPAGAVWTRTPQGHLQLQYQINMRQVGLDNHPQARQVHDELLRQCALKGQPNIFPPNSSFGPVDANSPPAGNPTNFVILLVPIIHDKELAGILEIWQDPNRGGEAQRGFLQFMVRMGALAAGFIRNHRLRQMVGQQQIYLQIETFAKQIHGSLNPTEVAYLVANEGRRLVEADRVSVALRQPSTAVVAISGADIVEKRSNLVQLMRKLFDAVIGWGERLVYTGTKDDTLPPKVNHALDEYLAESNSKFLVVMPLIDERDTKAKTKARSALMMECFETSLDIEQQIARLEVVSKHAVTALYNANEYRRIPMRFLWLPLAKVQDGLGGKVKAILTLIAVGLVLLIAAMIFVPYPLRVPSNGTLLPIVRNKVYAPVVGTVVEFPTHLKQGQYVNKGDEIIHMYDGDLAKQILQLQNEIAQQETVIRSLGNQTRSGPESEGISTKKIEAETTKMFKTSELLALRRLTNSNDMGPGYFSVRAPQAGIVLDSDFRENLTRKQVRPNEPLIRIGYVDPRVRRIGDWEVELKIPQKHIGQVLKAFEREKADELDVDLLLVSAPTQTYKGKLHRDKVAYQAVNNRDDNNEPEPVIHAWIRISGEGISREQQIPTDLLLTGIEVHSRVRCGNRAMGYSLFYGVWEFLYEKVVFFF